VLVSAAAVRMEYRSRAGGVLALDDVTFAVRRHEFLSIVGPSGCGKTTLLLLAAGLLTPSAGELRIDGRRLDGPYTDAAIVFQHDNLLEWRTVLDNVLLPAEIRRLDLAPYRHRARELLARVGLAGFERSYPHQLSGGMRQRTALCRALIHDLPLLLMDEPFAALDALGREEHQFMLQRLWLAQPKTVLFVTHDIREAVMLSDRVAVMSSRPGRILDVLGIDLPRPRAPEAAESADFNGLVRRVRRLLDGVGPDGGERR
jgi:NitT/TauT family transport system ATP-binding protein